MRTAPRPTRAEVTDAAHAVDEGADAIMLAGETAIGQYPVLAVATLDRILRAAEAHVSPDSNLSHAAARWTPHGRALCEAAVALATHARAEAIVAVTEGGRTARILSALRPAARILATTPNAATASRLALVWGVTPILTGTSTVAGVCEVLRTQAIVPAGASVVFVSVGQVLDRGDSNFVHIERL
jgi:pyruvate kinase